MNLLKEYSLKQAEDAVYWLNKYVKANEEEALHQYRVHIKKTRSVISFFEQQQSHEKKIKKLKKQLRNIFHSAGFIRECELHIQWLKKNRYSLLLQEASLEQKLPLYKQTFLDKTKKYTNLLCKTRESLAAFCSEVDKKSVFDYAVKLKQSITLSVRSVNKNDWHELRKSVKQLLYAYNWQSENEKIKLLTVNELAYFDQLQEAIGNWHDAEALKTWLGNEQFFLSSDMRVKNQFKRCWEKLLQETNGKEIIIRQLLKRYRSV